MGDNQWFFYLSRDTNYRITNVATPVYTLHEQPGNLMGVDTHTEWTLINKDVGNEIDVVTLIKGVGYWTISNITNLLLPATIIPDDHPDLVGKWNFDTVSELNNLNTYEWFFYSNYTNISFKPGLSIINYSIYTRNVLGIFEIVNRTNEWGNKTNEDITTLKGGQPYWIHVHSKPNCVTYKTVALFSENTNNYMAVLEDNKPVIYSINGTTPTLIRGLTLYTSTGEPYTERNILANTNKIIFNGLYENETDDRLDNPKFNLTVSNDTEQLKIYFVILYGGYSWRNATWDTIKPYRRMSSTQNSITFHTGVTLEFTDDPEWGSPKVLYKKGRYHSYPGLIDPITLEIRFKNTISHSRNSDMDMIPYRV